MPRHIDDMIHEFAVRGHVGNPNKHRHGNKRVIEVGCHSDMFADFAYHWCNKKNVTLFDKEFQIQGFFSNKYPTDERAEVTVYLMRVK